MRVLNFWNELSNSWVFKANVYMIPKRGLCGLVSVYLGTVELVDGSFIDIYQQTGKLVGVEYKEIELV